MKILVISLLRLGDLIMSTAALNGLRQKYPKAQIDLLVNKSSLGLKPLMSELVQEFVVFDRDFFQKMLGERDWNLLTAHRYLEQFTRDLSAKKYDIIINLTHNRLSGRFMQLIQCPHKMGLRFENYNQSYFDNQWLQWLNDQSGDYDPALFHFADIYQKSCGLTERYKIQLNTPANENSDLKNKKTTRIVVQPLTSCEEKNIPRQTLLMTLQHFDWLQPNADIVLLGAPAEFKTLQTISDSLYNLKVPHQVKILSLGEALILLQNSDLLLTGDTSIKHLASATKIPIVEFCLGWSNLYETGAYGAGHVILRSRAHTENPLDGKKHWNQNLSPYLLASIMKAQLEGMRHDLRILAEEFSDEVCLFETGFSKQGFWEALPLSMREEDLTIASRYLSNRNHWLAHLLPRKELNYEPR